MRHTHRSILLCAIAIAAFSVGCQGRVDLSLDDDRQSPHPEPTETTETATPADPDDPIGPVDIEACVDEEPLPVVDVPTRVLTSQELNNALATLFPGLEFPEVQMIDDSRVGPFVLNARENVPTSHVRDFRLMAEDVADVVSANVDQVAPCDTDDEAMQRMCAEDEVVDLAERAFRRPLEGDEPANLMALYETGAAEGGHAEGMRYVVEAVLQAPSFMYVVEDAGTPGEPRELTGYEIAQRMSALLWRSIPDEELLRAAEAGELSERSTRQEQARRMLDDPRGQRMMQTLVLQWLGIDRLDRQAFAQQEDNQALVESMTDETRLLVEHVVGAKGARWSELLTSRYTFVDQTLADHYGISLDDAEEVADGVWRVEMPERAGLLTHAGFLALQHGPVHRGLSIRKALLCGNVPGPVGVDTEAIPTEPDESERSKSEKRLADESCGGCHAMMDPLGLAFEPFGPLGAYRTEDEHGNEVSGTGEVLATADTNGEFSDATELAGMLADSEQVRECVAKNLFVWTYARQAGAPDTCTVARIEETLVQTDDNLREALVSIVADATFGERLTSGGEQ